MRPAPRLDSLTDTCALDVAGRGDHSLDQVGQLLGVTRERVRQIESRAMAKLAAGSPHLADFLPSAG